MSDTKKETKSKTKAKAQKPKSEPIAPEELQKYIDALVTDEHGAECRLNLDSILGAVADLAYSPEKKECALKLLCPPEAMPYERDIHFKVKDAIFQPETFRLIIRATSMNVYELRPAESPVPLHMLNNYGLTHEEWKELRESMLNALKY